MTSWISRVRSLALPAIDGGDPGSWPDAGGRRWSEQLLAEAVCTGLVPGQVQSNQNGIGSCRMDSLGNGAHGPLDQPLLYRGRGK